MNEKSTSVNKNPMDSEEPQDLLESPHPVFYADLTHLSTGFSGFRITFCIGQLSGKNVSLRPQVTVGMSPEHASLLRDLLDKNLGIYEEKFGKLRRRVPNDEDSA